MFKTITENFIEDPVLEMDITEPTDEIKLFGKTYRMYKDEWKHHVHIKCTNYCDANCRFCIERDSKCEKGDPDKLLASVVDLLEQMDEQGHLYTVSLTGGEPTAYPYINCLLDIIEGFFLKTFSINTNGRYLDAIAPGRLDGWIDVSKHKIHDKDVFQRDWEVTPEFIKRQRERHPKMKVRFQCVLGLENGLKSVDEIREYMDAFSDVVDDFSFRSLIIEDCEGSVPKLFGDFRKWLFDNGWCVQQTIQDYYVYEDFKPAGMKPITISWSNMAMLKKYNETHNNNFLEEIIVHPDGMITGSWNKKTLVIKGA